MNFETIMNKLNTIIKNELELGMHEVLEKDTQLLAIGIDSIASRKNLILNQARTHCLATNSTPLAM